MNVYLLLLALLSLLSSFTINTIIHALNAAGAYSVDKKHILSSHYHFVFKVLQKRRSDAWNSMHTHLQTAHTAYTTIYVIAFTAHILIVNTLGTSTTFQICYLSGLLLTAILSPFLAEIIGTSQHTLVLRIISPLATIPLFVSYPLTILIVLCNEWLDLQSDKLKDETESELSTKIRDLIHTEKNKVDSTSQETQLLLAAAAFKLRSVKEIMVPRVDMFCISKNTSLSEAATQSLEEGYSRIPVYNQNIDDIVGILLFKELIEALLDPSIDKHHSIESLMRTPLFTPQNKRVSQLLQEFKQEQAHLAIVVDEYGGTEGLISIEDILEELVGEIEDESDVDEEKPFSGNETEGFIVDAKMHLLAIEKELSVLIPHSADYETLGGFIFHKAGTIPDIGWSYDHDNFHLEVVQSDEKSITTVKVIPRKETQA